MSGDQAIGETKKGIVVIRQIRSVAGRTKPVVRTMHALGLRRIGDRASIPVNPATAGMVRRVEQLVRVEYGC
jgi:ribosomal protein L30